MTDSNNDLGPKKGETADQFKARIQETQRELKRAEAQGKPEAAAPPAAIPGAPPQASAQVSPPVPKAEVPPAGAPAPKPGVLTGNAEVDEWLGKKGFKSTEDMAQSLRELERELHSRGKDVKPTQPNPPQTPQVAPPAPGYAPFYPPAPPPAPSYGYPPPPVPVMTPPPYQRPPVNIEQLARQYGLSADDFEKLAPLVNDMAQSTIRQELNRVLPPMMNTVNGVSREVSRNSEMVNLMSDPSFRNPQVQFEMHRVLEENPAVFQTHPSPYRYAHETALMRIARANLGGSNPFPNAPNAGSDVPSTRPPATAGGNGNGGGGAPSGPAPEQIDEKAFAGMSLAEKKQYLQSVGAFGR